MRLRTLLLIPIAGWMFPGCEPELNEPKQLDTVRVLAVKKSAPFARPGADVDLKMLWFDGRPESDPGEDDVVDVLEVGGEGLGVVRLAQQVELT